MSYRLGDIARPSRILHHRRAGGSFRLVIATSALLLGAGCNEGKAVLHGEWLRLDLRFSKATVHPVSARGRLARPLQVPSGTGRLEDVDALLCHPSVAISYRVALARRPRLLFTLYREAGLVEKGSDGVDFQVTIDSRPVFRRTVGPTDPERIPVECDLASFAGKVVDLTFRSGPGPSGNAEYDSIYVVAPRILQLLPTSPSPQPFVLLVTLDTLRRDRLGAYGNPDVLTPALDRIARRGTLVEEAYAAADATTPSHATILTGRSPLETGVYSSLTPLPEEIRTLAERFRSKGYETAAVVSVAHLAPAMSGLGRGFDEFHAPTRMRDASATTSVALDLLDRNRSRPFFLWVHYFDPHTPYEPPDPYRALVEPERRREGDSIPDRVAAEKGALLSPALREWLDNVHDPRLPPLWYQGEVMHLSQEVGRLMRGVARSRSVAATRLVLTADHGESLGEHGIYYGHEGLFQPEVAIPLMVVLPGAKPALPRGPAMHQDLFQVLQGDRKTIAWDDPDRLVWSVHARFESLMVRRAGDKLIVPVKPRFEKNRRRYGFDLVRDPKEEFADASVPAELDEEARRLVASAKPYRSSHIPQGEAKKLRALGYLP